MEQYKKAEIHFRYHPEPLKTGAFFEGAVVCSCCHKQTPVFYETPFYAREDDLCFCPACIASGEAAARFDGCFTAPDCCDDIGDEEKHREICYRTPGYRGIQQEHWIAHCGDYCAYLGEIDYRDLTPELLAEFKETWNDRPQRWDLKDVCGSLGLQFDGYLFRCLHCGKHLLYAQRD